jgi:pimeloyl-ACP methyl ester carboxylesterase
MQSKKINGIEFAAGNWPLNPELDTIIFIHGSGGTNVLWNQQVKDLAGKANTIALNLPGHGNSNGPGMDSIEQYAKSVSKFIEEVEAKKPIICGLSIGGAIVLQLLIDDPEKYKAGIVANAGAKLKVMPLIFEMIEKDYTGFVNGMYTFGVSQKTDPSRLKPLADSMMACPPDVTQGDFTACNNFDVMDQLSQIKTSVLVMTASDDQLTPIKYGQFLADNIETASTANIEGAGHLSPVEKPDEVAKAIIDFMSKL